MKNKHLFGMGLLALALSSCGDDISFDQTAYDNMVQASFPVANIDPNQTWATIGTAHAEVTMNGMFANSTVKIYGENPIVIDQPTLLASGRPDSDGRFTATFSFKLSQQMVYVTAIDEQGYMSVVPASVAPYQVVSVEFGLPETSAARRRVLTVGSQVPAIDYATMEVMRETLLDGAVELTKGYADNADNTTPARLKISSGTWDYGCASLGDESGRTLYVGKNVTWNIPADTKVSVGRNGVIYLDEGAKIVLGQGAQLYTDNAGQLVFMRNTEVSDTGGSGIIVIANGTTGDHINYNAGTINVGTFNNNGGYFYNANELVTNSYESSSNNGQNVNRGSIRVNGNATLTNSALFNNCKFVCTGQLKAAYIVNANGAYIQCGSYEPNGAYNYDYNSHWLYLGANAIMDVQGEFNTQTGVTVSGPADGRDFGIFQCVSIPANNYMGTLAFLNNVYVCRKEMYVDYIRRSDSETGYWTNENWIELNWEGCFNKYGQGNGQAKAAAYQQVNFVKDEDECSPQYVPDEPRQVADQPQPFRFLFEDNFPEAGDYDFNDCVITVTPQLDPNDDKKVTVTVSLDAVGANKCISGAIRLVGVTEDMLTSKQCTSHFTEAAYPLKDNRNIPDGDFTTSSDSHSGDNSSVVMLLFKDAHWAMNSVGTSNAAVKRVFYNTMKVPNEKGETVPVKTATYVFRFNSAVGAQKMLDQATYDAFIVESYNGVPWEVHTVQNDRKGALVLHSSTHTDYQAYINAYVNPATSRSGKYTWAVLVPAAMCYPVEWQVIGQRNTSTNAIEGAYQTAGHSFVEWAENRNTATDWYNYATEDLVYF